MKTIALIDFALGGHHLSFVRTFSKILLEQGHRVVCIVPEPERIESWIEENIPGKSLFFTGHKYEYTPITPKGWGKFSLTVQTLHRWNYEGSLIKKIENSTKGKVDLVFYAWFDYQIAQYIHPFLLDRIFPYKWSGLYFHPTYLRTDNKTLNKKAIWRDLDAVLLSSNCIGIAIHDSGIIEKFSKRINKPVIHFPETADDSPPDFESPFYKEIKEKAKGRLVVGMIGCEKHKGTLTLIRAIKLVDTASFYFAFLGILPSEGYTESEWIEIQAFIAEQRENCFFHFQSIPEGASYNAVFCAFDIPYLVYDHFISSSNRLTKASIFKKLVLSSDNFCVGEDVKRYRLGEPVTPKSTEAVVLGLEKLKRKIIDRDFPFENWAIYSKNNSNEKLYYQFIELINHLDKK